MEINDQELARQLEKFTEGLNEFTRKGGFSGSSNQASNQTPQESFDKGTQKIVNALAKLGAELVKKNKSEEQSKKYIDAFNKSVDQATRTQQDAHAAASKMKSEEAAREKEKNALHEQSKKTQSQLLKEQAKAYEEYQKNTGTLSDRIVDLSKHSRSGAVALKMTTVALEGMVKSITQYSSSIYNGARGAEVVAKSLTTFGEAVGNAVSILSIFIPGGLLAKGLGILAGQLLPKVISGFTKYNELAAAQADKLRDTFMNLSKGGVTLQGGLNGTFDAMQKLGMSVAEASEFTSFLSSSTKDLRFFGATAGQGAAKFVEIAGQLTKGNLGRELELQGISLEEQRESALKYMSIQARTGQLQLNNTTALVKSAAQFTKELDLAAELAGNTRKEQLEARERAMSDERWRSAYQEALRTGDTDQVRALELAQAIAGQLEAVGDDRGAAGIRQLAAGRGAMTTEDAQRVATQYGANDILFNRNNSVNNLGQVMAMMSRNAGMVNIGMAGVNPLMGQTQLQTTGVGSYEIEALIKGREKAMEDAGFKGTIDEFLATEAGKKADEALKSQVNLRRAQQNAAMVQDKFINSFINTSKINEAAAKLFAKAVETFSGKKIEGFSTGGAPGGSGGTPAPSPAKNPMAGAGHGRAGGGSRGGSTSVPQSSTNAITEVLEAGRGFTTVATADGGKQRREGARNWRNNNPGNIEFGKFAESMGAIGSDGRFAVFPTLEMGKKAKEQLLFGDKSNYVNLSIADAISRYAPPNENDTKRYIDEIVASLGVQPGTILKSLQPSQRNAMLETISRVEGFKEGVIHPARTGGIFRGPSTGYNVELHGDEAVVPMNDGVSKQALNTSVFSQDTTMIDRMVDLFRITHEQNYQIIDLLSRQTDNSEKLVQATL